MSSHNKYVFLTLESREAKFVYAGFNHIKNGKMILIKRGNYINRITRHLIHSYTENGKYKVVTRALTQKIIWEQIITEIKRNSINNLVFVIYARVYETFGRVITDELRRVFPKAKFCVYFADLQKRFSISLNCYKRDFDYLFTFDKKQSEQYNIHYLLEPCTYKPMHELNTVPIYDVTYVGRIKNDIKRYNQIIQVFEKCRKASLKCDFHLVDVPLKLQKYANEIEYNKFMNFEEIIEHVVQSHTVLEILQKDEYSPTTRYTEACIYGRNLITNCEGIKDPFYTKDKNINLLEDTKKIDPKSIRQNHAIDIENYKKMFSIDTFIKTIEKVIKESKV